MEEVMERARSRTQSCEPSVTRESRPLSKLGNHIAREDRGHTPLRGGSTIAAPPLAMGPVVLLQLPHVNVGGAGLVL